MEERSATTMNLVNFRQCGNSFFPMGTRLSLSFLLFRFALMSAVLLLGAGICFSETVFETHHGFSITLPSDWTEIPEDILNEYSENISNMYPDAPSQTYEYGYQLQGQSEWLTYPYILIQVKETGRIASSSLKNYKKVRSGMESGASEVKESFSGTIKEVGVDEPVFDEEFNTLFSVMTMDLGEMGIVKGLIAVVLTEAGTINIYGYSGEDDFASYADLYTGAVRQIRIDENLKYKPGLFESIPVISAIQWRGVIFGGVIAAVIATVAMLFRKKS